MTLPRWALLLAPACGWISNHALTVGFDGSAYHGWQADPTVSTVEGELQRAIHAAGLATWTTRVRAKQSAAKRRPAGAASRRSAAGRSPTGEKK